MPILENNIVQIARIAHETNRAYCESIGDKSQFTWEDAPEWQKDSIINGVKFHLDAHDKGRTPSPSASHESWLSQKRNEGWTYGPVKDPIKKQHPCFLSYSDLPIEQRMKDYLFGAVVKAFVDGANASNPC